MRKLPFREDPAILSFIIDMMPFPIVWMTYDSVIRGCNDAYAQTYFKTTPDLAIGRSIKYFIPSPAAEYVIDDNRRVMDSGIPVIEAEEKLMMEDGLHYFLISKLPLRDEKDKVTGIYICLRDITVLKNTEEALKTAKIVADDALLQAHAAHKELKEHQAVLMQSEKIAGLGTMASGLAHEINSPLAIIRGNLEGLQLAQELGTFTPERFADKAHLMIHTVDRIAVIIKSLKTFSRNASAEERVEASIKSVIEETLVFCIGKIRNAGIKVDSQIHEGAENAYLRPIQISQVLLNLLNNACDAVGAAPDKWIRIEARALDGGLELSVTNSGIKIAPEVMKRIGEPFFTTKPVGKGTGLGISISQGIVSNHDGKLFVDRENPHTRFCIFLPSRKKGT